MLAATLALTIAVLAWRHIGRATGLVFLGSYAAYTAWLVARV
jgi:cation:H+ antiporter